MEYFLTLFLSADKVQKDEFLFISKQAQYCEGEMIIWPTFLFLYWDYYRAGDILLCLTEFSCLQVDRVILLH